MRRSLTACGRAGFHARGPQWATVGFRGRRARSATPCSTCRRGSGRRTTEATRASSHARAPSHAHARSAGQAQQRAKPGRGGMRLLLALLDIYVCVCVDPYQHPCLDPCLWVYVHAALSRRALNTAHSSVAVSPGWRRCRCGVSPLSPPAPRGCRREGQVLPHVRPRRRELAPVDRRGEGAPPRVPAPMSERVGPVLGQTDVPRLQMWRGGLERSRAGVSGVAQSGCRGGHQ